MINLKKLELDPEIFKKTLRSRGFDSNLVDQILTTNKTRKSLIKEVEGLKAYQNKTSKEIVKLKKKKEDISKLLMDMKDTSHKVSELLKRRQAMEKELKGLLLHMPNLCHKDVPIGEDEKANKVLSEHGKTPRFSFQPKSHVELGEHLNSLDFESASSISGARFVFVKGKLAQLERAIANFMLDCHTQKNGYEEINTPLMTHSLAMEATGQLPKFSEEMFYIPSSKHYLISTSEIPLVNLFRDKILQDNLLPIYVTAYTPCFRAEAGSYGKDTKGMIRQHQFHKVELVKITHPETSYQEHEKLTENATDLLDQLGLCYRKVLLSTGDIGFAASKCYDIEVWIPSQNTYREISSCSNCEDFQARRANIRFRKQGSKPQWVHTLNGSGLAVGRTLIAIMENFQNEDGSITIPEVLRPYMKGLQSIR